MSLFPELDQVPGSGKGDPEPGAGAHVPPRTYLALARKYRPGTFAEVVGQEAVCATLKNAICSGRLHHAYLFSGIRGVGKTTAARLFARSMNCAEGPTPDPCGACDPCREIASGLSLDVIEIDAASNRGVDDVEPLREAARYAPSRDRYKVFILDEVHMLSTAAFNSLLKILEEPPPRIVWILATTEYRKVPPTVVSRCQHFEFRRVPRGDVARYLGAIARAEKAQVAEKGLEIMAGAAGGSVRDAVSLLDQVIAYAGSVASEEDVRKAIGVIDRRLLIEFIRLVAARDASNLLELIARLADGGTEFTQFAAGLVSTVREATLLRFSNPDSGHTGLTSEEAGELRELGSSFSEDGLLRVFHALLELPGQLRGSPQPRFALEAAGLRLTRLADLSPIEEVISRLEGSDRRPPSGSGGSQPDPSKKPPAGGAPEPRQGSPASEPPVSTGTHRATSEATAEEPVLGETDPDGNGGPDWRDRLLAAAQSRRLSLRTFLAGADRIRLNGDSVEVFVSASQRFFREGLESPENMALLREAAAEVEGRPMNVSIRVEENGGDGSEPARAAPAGPAKRESLLRTALSRPGVKMVMDAFSGQIVDIKEIP
jgi:DNA polymerase-3 subunit gamma/tau